MCEVAVAEQLQQISLFIVLCFVLLFHTLVLSKQISLKEVVANSRFYFK